MNKKAEAGLAIVAAIMIFIVGMVSINLLKDDITIVRGATGMNCTNVAAISDGTKLACLAVDATIPIAILAVFAVAGGLIINKFLKVRVPRLPKIRR